MNRKVEYMEKLMGWCPNARAHEARQYVNLENINSDVPARGEGGDTKSLGRFRKESTRIILIAISVTFVYFIVLNQVGINLIFLLAGTFISLVCFAFYWKTQIRIYNDLVKQPITEYSKKMRIATITIILVLSSERFYLVLLSVRN